MWRIMYIKWELYEEVRLYHIVKKSGRKIKIMLRHDKKKKTKKNNAKRHRMNSHHE